MAASAASLGYQGRERRRLGAALAVAASLHLAVLVLLELQEGALPPVQPLGAITIELTSSARPALTPPSRVEPQDVSPSAPQAARQVADGRGEPAVPIVAAAVPAVGTGDASAAADAGAVPAAARPIDRPAGVAVPTSGEIAALAAANALARLGANDPTAAEATTPAPDAEGVAADSGSRAAAVTGPAAAPAAGAAGVTQSAQNGSAAAAALDASLGAALVAVPVDSEARPSVPDAATGVAEEGSETVVWDDPLLGRSAVHTPPPQIPAGATMRGACEVVVEFELQPSGLLRDVVVRVGSGATNLDAAVVETMGEWQFTAAPVASTVRGRVTFICQVSG